MENFIVQMLLFQSYFGRGVPVFLEEWRFGLLSVKKGRIGKIRGVKKEEVKTDGL